MLIRTPLATEEVIPYSFKHGGYNFTLIDTPGFDDSRFSDDIIVTKVLDWLKDSAAHNKKLSGIIYMHRIVDTRIQGTARSSMNMFRRLCGPNYFANVVLATSFWSQIDVSEGAKRERELCDNDDFWGLLVKRGSKVCRVGYGPREDQKLLLRIAKNKKALIQAQEEMQSGVNMAETSAAREVNKNVADWAKIYDERLKEERARLQRELEQRDQRRRQEFNAQRAAIEEERRRKDAEALRAQEQTKRAWEERQQARAAERLRQAQALDNKVKELTKQRKLREQRQVPLEEQVHVKCIRKPVREIRCDKCKRHVNTRRSLFYRK